jgi:glutamate synthase domain-containing protein 3
VLGPVGANFGAGMTGGRAYLYDPSGRHLAALDTASVRGVRLSVARAEREDGQTRLAEVVRLLEAHRNAGSARASRILGSGDLASDFWLIEPVPVAPAVAVADVAATSRLPAARTPQAIIPRTPTQTADHAGV